MYIILLAWVHNYMQFSIIIIGLCHISVANTWPLILCRPCPDGFTFGHLYGKHTSLVTKHLWKFQDWPRVNSYYKSLISSFENRAIYSNDNMDSPVAWIVQYPFGRAGGLHTLKEYRDKHFGTLLSLEMSKVMESRGFMTWSITDSTATRKIMVNMGLSESESRVKCLVTCKL